MTEIYNNTKVTDVTVWLVFVRDELLTRTKPQKGQQVKVTYSYITNFGSEVGRSLSKHYELRSLLLREKEDSSET